MPCLSWIKGCFSEFVVVLSRRQTRQRTSRLTSSRASSSVDAEGLHSPRDLVSVSSAGAGPIADDEKSDVMSNTQSADLLSCFDGHRVESLTYKTHVYNDNDNNNNNNIH